MNSIRRRLAPVAAVLCAVFMLVSLVTPAAHATMIGTGDVLNKAVAGVEHARVTAALNRSEVRDALVSYGVEPQDVEARVAALTDDEARQLANTLEDLPAAGTDPLGFILIIFVILLVTDILGFTNVFPFVKKRAR